MSGQPADDAGESGQGQPPSDDPSGDGRDEGSTDGRGEGSTDGRDEGSTDGRGDGSPDGSSGGSTLWKWTKRVGIAFFLLIGLVAVLYAMGVIGVPTAGIQDQGQWGNVSEERTEIVTTVWIDNPNPVGLPLGSLVTVNYDVNMNDVHLAEGSHSNLDVPPGNNTKEVSTDLRNDRLDEWWAGYVGDNETIYLDIATDVTVSSKSFEAPPIEREVMTNETPMIDALSGSVNATADDYTRSVGADQFDDSSLSDAGLGGLGDDSSVTVGYVVERGWATWESVNESATTVEFHMDVHNEGDVPLPAEPDGLGFSTDANGVTLFEGETEDLSTGTAGEDSAIGPGESREVNFTVVMDNDNIDDWFTSHVENGERTTFETQFQAIFEEPVSGERFRIPGNQSAPYTCDLRTNILVENQTTDTGCGEAPA